MAFKVRGQGTYTGARNGDPTKLGQHGGAGMISYEEKTFTLATNQDQFIAQINSDNQDETRAIGISGRIIGRQPQNGGEGVGYHEEISYTLTAEDKHAVAIATGSPDELNRGNTFGVDFQKPKVSFHHETAHTLQSTSFEAVFHPQITCAVRRLTPVECERLQGFPDGYTDVMHKNKNASDAARYHALGNSWAVNVVRWIGERIQQQITKDGE
jgi:DNA (cytosine-5)-methyltransferase 1